MRLSGKAALGTVAAAALVMTAGAPVLAHPAHDLQNPGSQPLKGRHYDGVVDPVSPGGVPMEAMSDIRCEDGMAGIFPCHKVDLASFTPLPDLEATFVNDLWGWTDAQSGMQLAIVGTFEGTAFVDVTDGSNPVYLGTLESSVPGDDGNIWGDVRVYEDTAYIGSEAIDLSTYNPGAGTIDGFGVQVVDLTQFRGATGAMDVELTSHVDDVSNSHNISLNEDSGRMYVVGSVYDVEHCEVAGGALPVINGTGGAIVYDVATDPHHPEFIGCLTEDGYTHDIQCVEYAGPDADYTGREICIASNEDTVTIFDATDPMDPVELARVSYADEGWTVGNGLYTHQGWLSEDQSFFFLGDELDEIDGAVEERTTYIWDMNDLDDPTLVGEHTDGNTSIDHNMFVLDSLLYQANYTSGLWIYDTWKKEQARVTMRGYFDVFPSDDRTAFYGSWGTYPYFGDGKVVVTSSDEGLFVLDSRAKSSDNSVPKSKGKGQGKGKNVR